MRQHPKQFRRSTKPNRKRLAKNTTLGQETLAQLEDFANYKVSIGEPRPTRAWMLEEGLKLFFEKMKEKFPDYRPELKSVTSYDSTNVAVLHPKKSIPLAAETNFGNDNLDGATILDESK